MILGISHIMLTTNNNKKSSIIDLLLGVGYKIDFEENKLANNSEKIDFMFNDNIYHNITFLKHKTKYSIEIIEYKKITNVENNLLISFESKLASDDREVNLLQNRSVFYNKTLDIKYIIDLENKFIFKTNDNKYELKFWEYLGFKNINNTISIKSPLMQWRGEIEFIQDNCHYNYMDNIGINTLSLLANDIYKEESKIVKDKSKIFNMSVNKNSMRIFLIKRDSYNIELLEIK